MKAPCTHFDALWLIPGHQFRLCNVTSYSRLQHQATKLCIYDCRFFGLTCIIINYTNGIPSDRTGYLYVPPLTLHWAFSFIGLILTSSQLRRATNPSSLRSRLSTTGEPFQRIADPVDVYHGHFWLPYSALSHRNHSTIPTTVAGNSRRFHPLLNVINLPPPLVCGPTVETVVSPFLLVQYNFGRTLQIHKPKLIIGPVNANLRGHPQHHPSLFSMLLS